jgi:hypothetical protein
MSQQRNETNISHGRTTVSAFSNMFVHVSKMVMGSTGKSSFSTVISALMQYLTNNIKCETDIKPAEYSRQRTNIQSG